MYVCICSTIVRNEISILNKCLVVSDIFFDISKTAYKVSIVHIYIYIYYIYIYIFIYIYIYIYIYTYIS